EGAQGTHLDVDHGTYPFVTSSYVTAGGAAVGSGVPPTAIGNVIGVVKAYTTRVGEGPFPTEFGPDLMERIRQKGREFGATTGRPRRCGWFDALVVSYSCMVNGIREIAVTKLDVLDDLETIKICTGYQYKGRRYDRFPASLSVQLEGKPIYESHPGWLCDTSRAKKFSDLPPNARRYLARLSELLSVPITIVSVGSHEDQTLTR
ncbi:MAG: adenylosuccinate synthetase, partial [Candidatus Omnitrophota bacterium]